MTWQVLPVPVPPALEAPEAWGVHAMAAISTAAERATWGHDDLAYTPRHCLTYLRNQRYSTRLGLAVVPDGVTPTSPDDVVGTATLGMPLEGNTHAAYLEVVVRPEGRGRGAGGALVAAAERLAAEHSRTTVIAATDHRGEPPDGAVHLEPPTGRGRIAADDAAAAFALHRGYALEQAERYSVLELPLGAAHLARLHDDAAARAGAGYRLHAWAGGAPDDRVDDVAHLFTRMSTDAPVGGLDIEEDPWDAGRVRSWEADAAAAEHDLVTVAAEHASTGRLVAFTVVVLPREHPEAVHQEDTLVLREHRGRRLGMLVKTAMLRRLADERPGARRVHTWNAEENAHMLGINVALGFRPVGVNAAWQRRLG